MTLGSNLNGELPSDAPATCGRCGETDRYVNVMIVASDGKILSTAMPAHYWCVRYGESYSSSVAAPWHLTPEQTDSMVATMGDGMPMQFHCYLAHMQHAINHKQWQLDRLKAER